MQTNFHDFFGFSDYLGLRAKLDFWTKNRQNEGSFGIALLEQIFKREIKINIFILNITLLASLSKKQ